MMNILILDDEIYLAQKVATRLQEEGYHTTQLASVSDVNFNISYDTILLSANLSGDFQDILKHYNNAIIILLVTYVSEATVTKPIKAGVCDYILKPFLMDELVRKIKHYEEFKKYKSENLKIKNYLNIVFDDIDEYDNIPTSLPLFVETNEQKVADKIVLQIATKKNIEISAFSLKDYKKLEPEMFKNELLYLYDFHTLKDSTKKSVLNLCDGYNVIISSNQEEETSFAKVTIMTDDNQISTLDSILTVNDYVKQITLNFQSKYTDTELSKRLGISRKSLWEKRKKFGIEKKKKDL